MKKFLNELLTSLVLLASGILLLIYPMESADTACYLAGAICIIIAVIKFILSMKNFTFIFKTIHCILLFSLGITLITFKSIIIGTLPVIVGTFFLIYGSVKLFAAFMVRAFSKTTFIKLFVSALIGIVLAVVIILFHGFANEIIFRLIGVLLIYNAVENIFSAIISKPFSKRKEKDSKDDRIHAEFEDAD
ncbi:MAG: hypothetical protein E7600_09410 [Ruminococcaceae bacterium]|nr:hypothetical protein [Oscillospiraceae bacterium]